MRLPGRKVRGFGVFRVGCAEYMRFGWIGGYCGFFTLGSRCFLNGLTAIGVGGSAADLVGGPCRSSGVEIGGVHRIGLYGWVVRVVKF
jgi:hypothetical protein